MRAAWGRASQLAVICAALSIFAGCPDGSGDTSEVVPVRISPLRVAGGDTTDGASACALSGRATRVGWSPASAAPAGPVRVRVSLGKPTTITHLKIFGASPSMLDARSESGDAIRGLEQVRLDALGAGWNELRLPSPSTASEIVLELTRTSDAGSAAPAPIGE